jgi:hypothetical protein
MKYRPIKPTEFAMRASQGDFWDIGKAVFSEALAHSGGNELWICGNIYCLRVKSFSSVKSPPLTCKYCNGGIDWLGIKTKISMNCPKCPYKTEDISAKVCPMHTPDQTAALQPTEVLI